MIHWRRLFLEVKKKADKVMKKMEEEGKQ